MSTAAGTMVLVLCAVAPQLASTQSPPDVPALLDEAGELYRSADLASSTGDRAGAADALRGALLRYLSASSATGEANGRLLYNIANTYLRSGDVGRAILYYRRAGRLIPGDGNLRRGLAYARQRRTDRVQIEPATALTRVVFFWHVALSTRTRAIVSLAAFNLFWLVTIAGLVRGGRSQLARATRPVVVVCAVMAVTFVGSLAVEHIGQSRPAAVIVADAVIGRQGDGQSYEPSFDSSLHAGTEVRVLEDREQWWRVRLEDGRQTWIAASAAELVP